MTNYFRPVDGDQVLPDRIEQGKSWRNISFPPAATIEDYKGQGLYLEVDDTPPITNAQELVLEREYPDHINKTAIRVFKAVDRDPMEVWEEEMAAFDQVMPRPTEDLWDAIGIDKCSDEFVKAQFKAKKAKRAEKPTG
ncbi:MAG: hypothetical protein ACPKM1_15700 [Spirochaetaceae bacterium]